MYENRLGFSTCLTQCTFDLHCKMWEVDEAMCGIDDHLVMFHKVKPYNWSCQFLHHDEIFREDVVSNVKIKCGCCYRFF